MSRLRRGEQRVQLRLDARQVPRRLEMVPLLVGVEAARRGIVNLSRRRALRRNSSAHERRLCAVKFHRQVRLACQYCENSFRERSN